MPTCYPSPPRKRRIKLRARTRMIVIPVQARIHCTCSTAGSGQSRSEEPHIKSETCGTVDPGLRQDDVASILSRGTSNWITASESGCQEFAVCARRRFVCRRSREGGNPVISSGYPRPRSRGATIRKLVQDSTRVRDGALHAAPPLPASRAQ
jgi:hypothetical protein